MMRPTQRYGALLPGLIAAMLASVLAGCGGSADQASVAAARQGGAPAAEALSDASAPATAEADTSVTASADTSADTAGATRRVAQGAPVPPSPQPNADGTALTTTASGLIDTSNAFFTPMGNGRSCASCHAENSGWSVTPNRLQQRFAVSAGADPVFRPVDGANSPNAPVATLDQKRVAYSMLLTKGLIRVGQAMPANAEFSLVRTDDPYGYASAKELSLFRRPLPSTNLKFVSTLMWDARETRTVAAGTAGASCILNANPALCYATVDSGLLTQASDAVRGHAEAARELTAAEQRAIVNFEAGLVTAQSTSATAGSLTDAGATGGPAALSAQAFYFGINDLEAGDYRTRATFNRNAMSMFGAWRNLDAPPRPAPGQRPPAQPAQATAQNVARASIARGEQLFNNRPFTINRVAGFTDQLRVPNRVTCSSCHSAPNAGSHSTPLLVDIGVADARFRTPDMPLYTLRNNVTGETVDTTDPGLALQTGRWRDIGRMKVPTLRGLAARAPYFHNGSQGDLAGVVRFYDRRFQIGLTQQEVADLSAFLRAL
ncbi:cytochrome C [Pseudoduganella rivuli]|uniref:cytochrome C n=1 Tax=Pseudoduganella rivuli TaxID=2666085 RepID=UPI001E2E1718|nr:cytochrome C [Pseudoduganella rivuli]